MERAMKVQDVMLQAMAKKITWWQAAEILGISDRHMRRWRERYVEEGYNGLLDRRRGKPSRRRVPVATVEKVFALYRDKYFDLNVQHFHEKLQAEHGIELSYTWVKQALQGAGLVARGRERGAHRKRRERRPLPGMLLHIDGSRHQWFQDERWYDLIVILDDATSEIYYAQLVPLADRFRGDLLEGPTSLELLPARDSRSVGGRDPSPLSRERRAAVLLRWCGIATRFLPEGDGLRIRRIGIPTYGRK